METPQVPPLLYFPSTAQDRSGAFAGECAVMATMSIGHVGGLAIDLLAHNLRLACAGYLEDTQLVPVAGNDPLPAVPPEGPGQVATNLQVYHDAKERVAFIQQRSPACKNQNRAFARRLAGWIEQAGFSRLVLLASIDSARRVPEAQFRATSEGPIIARYFATEDAEAGGMGSLPWQALERDSFPFCFKRTSFVAQMVEECERRSIPTVVLAVFCAEGFNIPHAAHLAGGVMQLLSLSPPREGDAAPTKEGRLRLTLPPSWARVQSERQYDQTLFG